MSQEKDGEDAGAAAFDMKSLDKDQEQQKLELEMQKRRERIEKVRHNDLFFVYKGFSYEGKLKKKTCVAPSLGRFLSAATSKNSMA